MATAGPDRNTPLHLAAMKGFTNVGKKLVESGAYVDARNKKGHNPLYLAVKNQHCDFAVLMVKCMEPTRFVDVTFELRHEMRFSVLHTPLPLLSR